VIEYICDGCGLKGEPRYVHLQGGFSNVAPPDAWFQARDLVTDTMSVHACSPYCAAHILKRERASRARAARRKK